MKERKYDFDNWEDGLNDLFREAADSEQPAPPPHAWAKMNRLLDEDERKTRRFFAWWWLPLLLFLAAHEHMVPSFDIQSVNLAQQRNAAISGKKASTPEQRNVAHANKQDQTSNTQSENKEIVIPETEFTENVQASGSPVTKIVKPEIQNNNLAGWPLKKSFKQKLISGSSNQSLTVGGHKRQETVMLSVVEDHVAEAGRSTEPYLPGLALNKLSIRTIETIAKTVEAPGVTLHDLPAIPAKKQQRKTGYQPAPFRLFVYTGAGADRGFVRNHPADFEFAWGGGLGVNINKRWSVQAGFQQTRKVYEANGNDYTPKKGSYYDNPNYVIKEVEADCAILEIPVSIRYNFYQKKRNGLFAMLSLQSAYMQRETYDYYYLRYGQPAEAAYTYRTGKIELLSGLGFSLGYERAIGKRIHWQIAPYFGVPTKGIGEGSVKLKSAGVFTGLRYSFWKK